MNIALYLVLPVVGGYAFSTIWAGSLYHSSRESGHRLYFRAVFYAVFMLVCATLLHVIFFAWVDSYVSLLAFINEPLGIEKSEIELWGSSSKVSILILSFVLGPLLGHFLNSTRFISSLEFPWNGYKPFDEWNKYIISNAIKNNDFEKLIARSAYMSIPILFTLNTGKVYVGWAVSAPNPTQARKAVRILPLMSGYRSQDNQKPIFTTEYLEILKLVLLHNDLDHLVLEDFEVVLPADQICASHLFDLYTYKTYFSESKSAETE